MTRIGAYVVALDDAGRILLSRIAEEGPGRGAWTLPGGGLEFGEDPEVGALRELEEETGLRAEIEGVGAVTSRYVERSAAFGGRPVHALFIIYRARITGGELRPEVGGSTDSCAWFTRENADLLPLAELGRVGVRLTFPALEAGA